MTAVGQLIHGRKRDGQWRYRIWSTVCDAYTTKELTEAQLRRELMRDYTPREVAYAVPEQDIPRRLARVHENGTSSLDDRSPDDVGGPWDTEPCDGCGGFHHEYKPRSDGACGWCGNTADDDEHGPQDQCLAAAERRERERGLE